MTDRQPILMPCEGSERPGHRVVSVSGELGVLCSMCGWVFPATHGGAPPVHTRSDITAMLERGDFDSGATS